MRTFKDKDGLTWNIAVDAPSIKAVKQQTGVLITDIVSGGEGATAFWTDLPLMVDVIYVLCKEQCDKRELSDLDFGRLLTGDVLEDASKKLVDETIDFFPNRHQRETLKKQVAKAEQMNETMLSEIDQKIDSLTIDSLKLSMSKQQSQASTQATPDAP